MEVMAEAMAMVDVESKLDVEETAIMAVVIALSLSQAKWSFKPNVKCSVVFQEA